MTERMTERKAIIQLLENLYVDPDMIVKRQSTGDTYAFDIMQSAIRGALDEIDQTVLERLADLGELAELRRAEENSTSP
jgi:hypothetical protein